MIPTATRGLAAAPTSRTCPGSNAMRLRNQELRGKVQRPGMQPLRQTLAAASNDKNDLHTHRNAQLNAAEVMKRLLEAKDMRGWARENMTALTEEFFHVASAYLELVRTKILTLLSKSARREGDRAMVDTLERVLRVAMEEKNKTLRPEMQLLNELLAAKTSSSRKSVLSNPGKLDVLKMNDGYFFRLLDHMIQDTSAPSKGFGGGGGNPLSSQLQEIKRDALKASR